MFVLVELARETNTFKAQETWDLLAKLYSVNCTLSDLPGDRRRHHAAELIVAAWKTSVQKFGHHDSQTPNFVVDLKRALGVYRTAENQSHSGGLVQQQYAQEAGIPATPESFAPENDFNAVFDLDFQDIDWSYWNSKE